MMQARDNTPINAGMGRNSAQYDRMGPPEPSSVPTTTLVVCQPGTKAGLGTTVPSGFELIEVDELSANPEQAAKRAVVAVAMLAEGRMQFLKQVEDLVRRGGARTFAAASPLKAHTDVAALKEWLNAADGTAIQDRLRKSWSAVTAAIPCWPFRSVSGLVTFPAQTILSAPPPAQQYLFDPVVPDPSLSMVFAKRGVGKTHFALGLAVAAATGGSFLRFTVPKAKRVLFVDGEMPPGEMARRLNAIPGAPEISSAYLQIMSAAHNPHGLPDLSTEKGQQAFMECFMGFDFIVLDNLSSLCTLLKENDGDSWAPIQRWLLHVRRQRKSVMLVHHGGKSGSQRGTSRKEDVLDTVFELAEPPGKTADAGAVFDVHLTKARSAFGTAASSFRAQLCPKLGVWSIKDVAKDDAEVHAHIRQFRDEGLSFREIAERLGMSKSSVARLAQSEG